MSELITEFRYINTPRALDCFVNHLRMSDSVALDTEADSLHHYYEKVCLIQIAIRNEYYLIDPLAELDMCDFLDVLREKTIIIHGAVYDLHMLRLSLNFRPGRTVFDTMIASRLLGLEQSGLTALIERYFNVSLSKRGQKSDWSQRPLSERQLQYAIDDIRYLSPLADILETELRIKNRERWHRETCERMMKSTESARERSPDEVWRIRGAGLLKRRELSYLRELWRWRDTEAQALDIPAFKIISNEELLDLAIWSAEHPNSTLPDGRKLPDSCRGRRLRELNRALKTARRMPRAQWPRLKANQHIPHPGPVFKRIHRSLRYEALKLAADFTIEPSVLVSRNALFALALHCPESIEDIEKTAGLMRWQAELLHPVLQKILKKEKS